MFENMDKSSSNDSAEGTQLLTIKNHSQTDSFNPSLPDNDSISFAGSSTEPIYKSARSYSRWSPIEEGVTLSWSDVSVYSLNKNKKSYKRIVNGVTGAVKAGSLVALMGASGAGKSTLMAALAHRNSAGMVVDGTILINGRPIGNYMKYLSGFMHQEDIFVESLTVYEHINIMAQLKLDRRVPNEEKRHIICNLLKNLGLMKCLNTRIGGNGKSLSGGEKKRLAFATELLTDPPILFCDEPTTGLDSYSAEKLVTMMNSMASSGKTILCTIHQPSSYIFSMFSQLILVAEGRIAYMGSSSRATKFFDEMGCMCPSSYNPADFFIKTLAVAPGCEESSKQAIKRICDHFIVSDYAKEMDVIVQYEFHMGRALEGADLKLRSTFKEVNWITKLFWLTVRWFLEILRNPSIQGLRILQKMAVAAIVGLCYFGTNALSQSGIQSIEGAIFLLVTENSFMPMYAILADFPISTPLFLREYKSGLYTPLIYYLSRVLSLLPGLIIEPVLFVLVVYWLAGLRSTAYAYFMTTLIAILIMNTSSACGIFFGNAFESVSSAMSYLVPFDYILMVTSGVFLKLSTLPNILAWTKYMSWLMYSTEALSILQWSDVTNITCEHPNTDIPCITDGNQVLDIYSFSESNFSRNLIVMMILILIFHTLAFICLFRKTRK